MQIQNLSRGWNFELALAFALALLQQSLCDCHGTKAEAPALLVFPVAKAHNGPTQQRADNQSAGAGRMSQDCLSVTAGAERDIGSAGQIFPPHCFRSTTSQHSRCIRITVSRKAMQRNAGTRGAIVFTGELSGSFRDRVEADRMGAIRAGTSRHASFGFTPFA
ncbi:MAG: hypothetical protein J0H71_19160 [Rhizobiales bacterium]|nr:hypothetical protein [Hyphomicrobiales bacterium]